MSSTFRTRVIAAVVFVAAGLVAIIASVWGARYAQRKGAPPECLGTGTCSADGALIGRVGTTAAACLAVVGAAAAMALFIRS